LPPDPAEFTWEDFGASPEMREALVHTGTFLHLWSPAMVIAGEAEPLPFLQLGMAIMLDKPIIVMAERDEEQTIPEHLRRAADRVVLYDRGNLEDPATADALSAAIRSLHPED
jgi:hypothetical protein